MKCPYSWRYQISLQHSVGEVEEDSMPKKAQSIHSFNTISDCDRQAVTYRQTATANTMLALR